MGDYKNYFELKQQKSKVDIAAIRNKVNAISRS
jgi:hypothetical protein